jgi:SPX domain protein involved in polyphosphate accumulation
MVESFQRIEDKYLVPREKATELMALLEQHLEPCYLEPGTRFNMIESVYFDSESLKIFQEHFVNKVSKYKIRLRRYGPNGVWPQQGEDTHIEMKLKAGGVSNKFRMKLGSTEISYLERGRKVPLAVKKKVRTQERLGQINEVVARDNLQPLCRVTYKRRAFERDGFRVTIDDRIQAEFLRDIQPTIRSTVLKKAFINKAKEMRQRFTSGDFVVVEVKHSGSMPAWIRSYFTELGCEPVSFSKYAFSIYQHLLKNPDLSEVQR